MSGEAVFKVAVGLGLFGWSSFVLWKRMREEYDQEEILVLTLALWLVGLAAGGGGQWLVYGGGGVWRMGAGMGVVGTVWRYCVAKKWNGWEWGDKVGEVWLWVMLVWAGVGVKNWQLALGMALGIGLAQVVKRNYKKWRWYKSGKAGLVGLVAAGWWLGVEMAIAFGGTARIYWLGLAPELLIGGWLMAAIVVAIYLRSGRRMSNLWLKR